MIYLIPGLGADGRIFRNLLPLLRKETRVLEWLRPASSAETLPHYAARMAESMPLNQPCLLAGVSFGGVVALEIGRLRPLARVVLVSSIPDADRLPPLLRLLRATGLYRVVPPQLLKLFPRAGQWYFGISNGPHYQLFEEILRDLDPVYTRWAINRLLHWDSTGIGRGTQILGSRDRVFPPRFNSTDHLVPGGGHFMVITHAKEIALILNELV